MKRKQLERALEETERAHAELSANEKRFRTFMDSGPFVSYIKDADGRMLNYNGPFAEQFGVSTTQMLGKRDDELWPSDFAIKYRTHDVEVLRERKLKVVEEASPGPNGQTLYWKSYKFPCQEADGSVLLGGISLDVTESRQREEKLRRYQNDLESVNQRLLELATTDPLTGLANRRVFDEHLSNEFALARRRGRSLSLMLLDMDNFKRMNDTYGHDQGDSVLKQLSVLLCGLVRETDLVVRYGGEEFILLLPDTSEEQAMILGERVLAAVRSEDFGRGAATISGGIAELTAWCPNPKHMVSCADEALYAAKRAGKDRVVGYAAYQAIVNAQLKRELDEVG